MGHPGSSPAPGDGTPLEVQACVAHPRRSVAKGYGIFLDQRPKPAGRSPAPPDQVFFVRPQGVEP